MKMPIRMGTNKNRLPSKPDEIVRPDVHVDSDAKMSI